MVDCARLIRRVRALFETRLNGVGGLKIWIRRRATSVRKLQLHSPSLRPLSYFAWARDWREQLGGKSAVGTKHPSNPSLVVSKKSEKSEK